MEDQEKIRLEREDDAFAHAAQTHDGRAANDLQRWIDGTKDKRAGELHRQETSPADERLQGLDVHDDIRQLRHIASLSN
jgi:hypothetical protein